MSSIVLRHVTKFFAGKTAVHDLDLEIEDGEFVIIVGPSGCGKTTTLRMLAGFERPSVGTIEIGGKVVNNVSPKDRNLAMVFQSYALFPHMDVAKNLAFGMRIRHESKSSIERDVGEIAEMLGIHALLGRKPKELSGGERQRVALRTEVAQCVAVRHHEIADMNVIADTSTIGRLIIGAENVKLGPKPKRCLDGDLDQVGGAVG